MSRFGPAPQGYYIREYFVSEDHLWTFCAALSTSHKVWHSIFCPAVAGCQDMATAQAKAKMIIGATNDERLAIEQCCQMWANTDFGEMQLYEFLNAMLG